MTDWYEKLLHGLGCRWRPTIAQSATDALIVLEKAQKEAREEMREQIEKDMWDIFQSKRFAAQRPSIILKVIRNAKIND